MTISKIHLSGDPYFRTILSNRNTLSLFAWNTSVSDVGCGFAEHGDGIIYFVAYYDEQI